MDQILNILGEQVSLEPTTFDSSEKFLVSFDEKYKFPGITPQQETALKALLQKLFSGSKEPLPPCSDDEKDLVLKSLIHRFSSLRNELIAERQSQSDSLRLRQIVDHVQRLKEYIDSTKSSKACQELDEDILAETVGDLTDEQINELLKQFVFFILQGQHPLADFKGRDPNPKGFVARLRKKPMTDFDHFLDVYRHKKHRVPLPIEKVLEATKVDVEGMKEELEETLKEKIGSVIASIQRVLPPEHPFWINLDTSRLETIIDRLLENIQQLESDLEDCTRQALKDQSIIVDLDDERERLERELAALQGKLQIVQSNYNSFEKNSLEETISTEELEEVKEEARRTVAALEERIAEMEAEIDELNRLLDEAEGKAEEHQIQADEKAKALEKCKELEQTNKKLLVSLAAHQEKLLEAVKRIKECEDAEKRVQVLEKTLQTREDELATLRSQAGPLTQEIDKHLREKVELEHKKQSLEKEFEETNSLVSKFKAFIDSLIQDKSIVINLLGDIERQRASLVANDDSVLQKIRTFRQTLSQNDAIPSNLGGEATLLLKEVQEELAIKQKELDALQQEIEEKEREVAAAKQRMEESNILLEKIRNGRLASGEIGTDREYLEAAIRAVEAEKELNKVKGELETALQQSVAKQTALQQEVSALQERHQAELESIQGQLNKKTQELEEEKRTTATLRSSTTTQQEQLQTLQESLNTKEQELQTISEQLEQERLSSVQKIAQLEETKLRECEERLAALRQEEEKKREALVGLQGAEKGTLEGKIQELLRQITSIEGERDAFQAELEVEKGKLEAYEANVETATAEHKSAIEELQLKLKTAELAKADAIGLTTELEGRVDSLSKELGDISVQIIQDGRDKAKLFKIISNLAEWISSGGTTEQPTIDDAVNKKYGIQRIIDSFLSSLPEEKEQVESISTSMSRCYLVFFITYVYARHFPATKDADSSYQSEIIDFIKGILTELYKKLEVGIPGKLEAVGAGGIPIQYKSKYLMNLLMPLIKQMELVHESGKKGADFLKYSLLDKDQLATLHILHTIVSDKLKLSSKDIMKTINSYVIRKTGNVDDDIGNLFLRFLHETKTNNEYPVIVYQSTDPKATFGAEIDFTQYLASSSTKATQKVASPIDKQLLYKPVFSFNLLFYLFLFIVKDYLSSVEGELDKAGCPLPQILKHH